MLVNEFLESIVEPNDTHRSVVFNLYYSLRHCWCEETRNGPDVLFKNYVVD